MGSLVEKKLEIVQLALFVTVGYTRALRGKEILKLEITGLLKHFSKGDKTDHKHIMLSLAGRSKQEYGQRHHLLPAVTVPGSGLRIREWVRRLLKLKVKNGQTQGFLFQRKNGSPAKMGNFDEPLIERLVWIQDNVQGLIPMIIDLWDMVGCRRSVR
jgi:hypothetical protein